MLNKNLFPFATFFLSLLLSCSVSKQISRKADNLILKDSLFRDCHVGIALFDPVQNKMLYAYQAEKYFVPASNVKIATCYAVMKCLGKELPGMRYLETDTALVLVPTGDPTLLHQDFITHPVIEFLTKTQKKLYITDQHWQDHPLGIGWSWSDYNDSYMAERSAFPVYGNTIRWSQVRSKKENPQNNADTIDSYVYAEPDITWEVNFKAPQPTQPFTVKRNRDKNVFYHHRGPSKIYQAGSAFCYGRSAVRHFFVKR